MLKGTVKPTRCTLRMSILAATSLSIGIAPTAALAGVFLNDAPDPAQIPAEVQLPEAARARLQPDARGFVFIGDMAFNAERLGRLGFNGKKWPKGILPIAFDNNVSQFNRQRFFAACAEWSAVADVQCVPHTGQANWVRVHSGVGNWSEVGMQGGMQQMEIVNWDLPMTIAHEIAHALGGGHEQSRQDRDTYVTIVRELIQPGMEGNFKKLPLVAYTAYDFESIMHYPANAFSISGASTIVPKPGYEQYAPLMGRSIRLSQGDRESMRSQYGGPKGAMPLSDVVVATMAPSVVGSPAAGRLAPETSQREDDVESVTPLSQDPRTRLNDPGMSPKVVGGTPVAGNAFADTVGIGQEFVPGVQCTGTLIQPDVVLTAAHCVCADITGPVYFGNNPKNGGRVVNVRKAAHGLNSCSQSLKRGLDLAVLLLEAPVADVRPREIADDAVVDRATSFRAVGFGAIDFEAEIYPQEKREANIIATSNDCRGSVGGKSDQQAYGCEPGQEIVAGRKGTPDTCNGDSGGPLLIGPGAEGQAPSEAAYKIAAVTSRASSMSQNNCGDGGIYERLNASAREWIAQAIGQLR